MVRLPVGNGSVPASDPLHPARAAVTRMRWFCCLCGELTDREPDAGRRALCRAHSNVALDTVPPDPLTSLPMQAADTLHGEDASPATGTESC
jgi:hypothetical protein